VCYFTSRYLAFAHNLNQPCQSHQLGLTEKLKRSQSRYEKDIEKSFAVIYHNLKRIQDDKQSQEQLMGRWHSEPQITAPNPILLQKNQKTSVSRERSQSATDNNHDPRKKQEKSEFLHHDK